MQGELGDGDLVAVGEQLALDALAIDESTIRAAQVVDHGGAADEADGRVLARHGTVREHDVVVRMAADGGALLDERHFIDRLGCACNP